MRTDFASVNSASGADVERGDDPAGGGKEHRKLDHSRRYCRTRASVERWKNLTM